MTAFPHQCPAALSAHVPTAVHPLGEGAVLCTNCGYNTQSGERLHTTAVKSSKPRMEFSGAAALLINPVIVALAIVVVMGAFLALAWGDQTLLIGYMAVESIFTLGVVIMVLVFAFREGILTGFLTLCVPFYVLYFVFGVCDNQWVRALFGASQV